ncbi:MAG TPA: FAD-binding oxidoreductase [Euzebyales bacterium]|nr:FAD-binding oxidoreductase [Euzebyales bacterium]
MSRADNAERLIPALRAAFDGQVITPDNTAYDQTRAVFYRAFDRRPSAIVQVTDAAEVAKVVSVARDTGSELAVRSGGHSVAGHSMSERGIVIDLSLMREVDIDVAQRTAWAETGLTAGEYTSATAAHGLVTGFGDTASVGIGGITLGGGVGYLARRHGLTIDDVLAADVVTADGRIVRTDAEQHPDLFWAIRGGGGNFGVVTRFQYRLHDVDTIVGGMLMLPATPELVTRFVAEAEAAPDELTTICNLMVAPPMPFVPAEHHGTLIMIALLAHTGPIDAGARVIAPFRALATPLVDTVQPMRYPELYEMLEGGPESVAQEQARSTFIDHLDRSRAEAILEHLRTSTAPMAVAQLRVLGGAMARVPVDATAFAHRRRRIMIAAGAVYEDAADTPVHTAWVDSFAAAVRQGAPGVYVNFLGDEGDARVREAYPEPTWDRLTRVKAAYDPTNLFRMNHNIPPSPDTPTA